jgi:hypothetical protein
MLAAISEGQVDAVIVWHLDQLHRQPDDGVALACLKGATRHFVMAYGHLDHTSPTQLSLYPGTGRCGHSHPSPNLGYLTRACYRTCRDALNLVRTAVDSKNHRDVMHFG